MSSSADDLAAVLATVGQALAVMTNLSALAARTCQLAAEAIEGCDHADVMLVVEKGALTVPGATDWVGVRVVSIESELNEGPCVDAFENNELISVADVAQEQRWPGFTPRCLAESPVRSALGVPLAIGGRTTGALNLYAERPNVFGDEARAAGALFAAHASIAFNAMIEREQLQRAVATRDVIGQAKGILMARSQVSGDEAFDMLRRASQRLNERLLVIAQRVIDNAPDSGDG